VTYRGSRLLNRGLLHRECSGGVLLVIVRNRRYWRRARILKAKKCKGDSIGTQSSASRRAGPDLSSAGRSTLLFESISLERNCGEGLTSRA